MLVGILSAIDPHTSQVNWDGSPIDAYVRFFRSAGAPFEFRGYEAAQGELPLSPDSCDAYVITGSPSGAYEAEPWILALTEFVRSAYAAGKKLVGICFGHQLLANALGGEVVLSDRGWGLGPRTLDVSQERPWMIETAPEVTLYFAHQDQVVRLPPEAKLLGGDGFCPIGMYEIEGRVLGVQGHPEFDAGIMEGIIDRMEGRTDTGRLSSARLALAESSPDNSLVGQWLVRFLLGESGG